jgi:Na+/H+ antiporter NhaD/arsenite permease-like protein
MELMIATILPSSWNVAIVLFLLALAVALFASEVLTVDIITLLLLIVLMAMGILTPAQAFEGFSSEIIIILASIFVLCGALQDTGSWTPPGQVCSK